MAVKSALKSGNRRGMDRVICNGQIAYDFIIGAAVICHRKKQNNRQGKERKRGGSRKHQDFIPNGESDGRLIMSHPKAHRIISG